MIVVRLFAGLGNQLFQYAAARELGRQLRAEVRFDAHTWFAGRDRRRSTRRDFLLPQLGLDVIEASPRERQAPFARTWWGGRRPRPGWTHLQQIGGDVPVEAFGCARAPVFLEGYWQSEAFFAASKATLAAEVIARQPSRDRNHRWLEAVRAPGAIALHVRRGDYVTSAQESPRYRVLGPEYYQKAIARLRTAGEEPRAVVFSDDPDWCEQHLQLGLPTQIVRRADPYASVVDDFLCLAQASTLVTANSTFSWWAAWIASQRGPARVIAPAQWFDDPAFAEWSRHLAVPGWEQL